MNPYLQDLTIRLAIGIAALDEPIRKRHAEFLLSKQREDGGFAGREGESDLYYTGFALRSLGILGELYGEPAERSADFLRNRLTGHETIIDFVSLIYGAALLETSAGIDIFEDLSESWRDNVANILESLRRDDGGYAKAPEGNISSTYHSFLVLICRELIERPIPSQAELIDFIESQRAESGGFLEIKAGKRAGTNPTAAAIGVLKSLGAITDAVRDETTDFLLQMQTDEGGLRANTRIPIADLLSTFTGLLTLQDLDAGDNIDKRSIRRFTNSLQNRDGGFMAAAWDEVCDVEYTFYGLGVLALLAEHE